MRLRPDDRGVTVQIGTVLLFAVLIVLLSTYQASVVPQQNEQVEFNHNERVQGQLQDLRDELLRTAATGSGGSTSVELGTQYPVRAIFVNPAPPSGTLATTSAANVRLANAEAAAETGDYWNGDVRAFRTRGLTYDPVYHVYRTAPTTVYRNGVLYNRFEGADRVVAGQQLVRGNTISLVALTGRLSKSSSRTASVNLRPVSQTTRTVTVSNESGERIKLVVPTELTVEKWRTLLESERDPAGTDPQKHVAAVENAGADAVRIVLERGVYELQLAKVGVGSDQTGVAAHYATDVRGDEASVAEGSRRKLVVEVRDRYNNPVTGARVNLSIDASAPNNPDDALIYQRESKRSFENLRTDAEGRVTVRFDAGEFDGSTRQEQVNVSIEDVPNADFDAEAKENVTFDLQVYSLGGAGSGPGGPGEPEQRAITKDGTSTAVDVDGDGTQAGVTFGIENTYDQQVTITDVRVDPQRGTVKRLSDPSSNEGKWQSEVYVDGDVRDGIHDYPGGRDLPATFDMDRDWAYTTESVEPVLSAGGKASFYLYQFRTNPDDQPIDMAGEQVEIQLTYQLTNGTTGTDTITITPTEETG